MAATMAYHRQKKVVRYGKATSRTNFSTMHMDDFMEDDPPAKMTTATRPAHTIKDAYAVEKPGSNVAQQHGSVKQASNPPSKPASKPAPRLKASGVKKQDLFDVPSSEDEEEVMVRRPTPPRLKTRRNLVNDTHIRETELAPWEKKAISTNMPTAKVPASSGARPKAGPQQPKGPHATNGSPVDSGTPTEVDDGGSLYIPVSPPTAKDEPVATSALARLRARRANAGIAMHLRDNTTASAVHSTTKRPEPSTEDNLLPTRKRVRRTPAPASPEEDVRMDDAQPEVVCEAVTNGDGPEIFNVPDDTEDARAQPKMSKSAQAVQSRPARRGKKPSYSKPAAKKGLSAPGRLSEMLSDADSSNASSRPPSIGGMHESRQTTPRKATTPMTASNTFSSPEQNTSPVTAMKDASTLMPKQASLWDCLLPGDSPSALPVEDLRISDKRQRADTSSSPVPTLTRSKSDVPEMHGRRTRLVDRLKALAPKNDEDSEDEDASLDLMDVEGVTSTTRTIGPNQVSDALNPGSQNPSQSESQGQSQSQSQSMSGVSLEGNARITYARTRSYLPEDNFEDGLLAATASFTPVAPKQPGRNTQTRSQRSTFDIEDGDDEGGTARMRTVHELRAAGRNQRFEQQTLALLEDISNHNISARSRRRSALVEMATKLMEEEGFVDRFLGQGFEVRLVAECAAPADEIADFALAASFVLLLTSEQSIAIINDEALLRWVVGLLGRDIPIGKLVKDRRNNMSKSAQSTMMDLVSKLLMQPSMQDPAWKTMTPRLLALKALDQLLGRLRRAGNKSELLGADSLLAILGTTNEATSTDLVEATQSLSILELLCATTQPRAWPGEALSRLSRLVHSVSTQEDHDQQRQIQHARFLAYRLLLALSNDNVPNSQHLSSTPHMIHDLLQAISSGFTSLSTTTEAHVSSADNRALQLDLVVLSLGVMINLAENPPPSPSSATPTLIPPSSLPTILPTIIQTFTDGQQRALDAESEEDTRINVAYGYLAIMLANICLSGKAAREQVKGRLPGKELEVLVEAVREFVTHNQRVDTLEFEGAEGREVWGRFTERLRGVLGALEEVVGKEGE